MHYFCYHRRDAGGGKFPLMWEGLEKGPPCHCWSLVKYPFSVGLEEKLLMSRLFSRYGSNISVEHKAISLSHFKPFIVTAPHN